MGRDVLDTIAPDRFRYSTSLFFPPICTDGLHLASCCSRRLQFVLVAWHIGKLFVNNVLVHRFLAHTKLKQVFGDVILMDGWMNGWMNGMNGCIEVK